MASVAFVAVRRAQFQLHRCPIRLYTTQMWFGSGLELSFWIDNCRLVRNHTNEPFSELPKTNVVLFAILLACCQQVAESLSQKGNLKARAPKKWDVLGLENGSLENPPVDWSSSWTKRRTLESGFTCDHSDSNDIVIYIGITTTTKTLQ